MKLSHASHRQARVVALLFGASLIFWTGFSSLWASDWVQWRGNALNGIAASPPLLQSAQAYSLNLASKAPLGSGYASVSIKGKTVITMATQDKGDYVLALHADTGALIWRYRLEDFFIGQGGADDGPLSTPTIDRDRVYALSARGRLVALQLATGSEIWSHDLTAMFGGQPSVYGYSTVPLVFEDKVLVAVGGTEKRTLVAFRRTDGKALWTSGIEDRVIFHNPLLVDLLGQPQCLVPTSTHVFAVDPRSGTQLWEHKLEGRHGDTQVVPIDTRRFVLASDTNLQLFKLDGHPGAFKVKRIWKSLAMKNTHGAPVHIGDYLYGFNGTFLTCARLADGKAVWKTRKPGGQNLIALGNSLVFWDHSGSLVLAKAHAEGYHEQGRLKLSDQQQNYVPPSFANGNLFLRDLENLYVVTPKPAAVRRSQPESQPKAFGVIARLQRDLKAGNPEAKVAAFKAAHPTWPIWDRAGWVHFLYEGAVEDIAIIGDMTGSFLHESLYPIEGTTLHYRSYQMEAGNRWEYQFSIFEETFTDPKNPLKVKGPEGEKSVAVHSEWRGFKPSKSLTASQKGSLHTIKIDIPDAEEDAEVQVYLPPGHSPKGPPLPFFMVSFGKQALEFGNYPAVLDQRHQRGGNPLAAVFLKLPQYFWYSSQAEKTAQFLEEQVLPQVFKEVSLATNREQRALLVQSWSSQNALRFMVTRGQNFGIIGFQSPFLENNYRRNYLDPHIAALPKTRFVFRWGRYDYFVADSPLDISKESRINVAYVAEKGHEAVGKMHPGGTGWVVWQSDLDAVLDTMFPEKP